MIRAFVIKGLNKCIEKLQIEDTSVKTHITSLAPKVLTKEDDLKKIKPYLTALKNAIDDTNITNIAISGSYGSGKSTIIKTFQNQNKNKYLNISLASFNDNEDKTDLERRIEISILQQMIYRVKPKTIPDSRFKRIINITTSKIWFVAICFIIWLISSIILFKFNYINKINPNTWTIDEDIDLFSILLIVLFFIGIGFLAKFIIRLFSNSKINKINIKGELELGETVDKSVFNQHLEEILYFFERTDFNIVVLEDIDRFDSTDIFTKLRELNLLLNNTELISRKIKFIYAIKDDVFTDKKERVKFFDYIIPVIPFINPSNASEQLTKLIVNSNLSGILSSEFTDDIITFINDIDMRLLINIFHEYKIYKSQLNDTLNQDELFAIIIYKNLFPKDFGELDNRNGKLYQFISNKGIYIKQIIAELKTDIETKELLILNTNNELINSIKELKSIYLTAIQEKIPQAVSLTINNKVFSFKELLENEIFGFLQKAEKIIYNSFNSSYNSQYNFITDNNSKVSFKDIEKLVSTDFTFAQRELFIKNKKSKAIDLLKSEITKLKNNISEIESWNLKQIFEEIDIEPFLKDFPNDLLVRNLLLNGYINEHYNDYISLFHEVNLTKEDFAFEQRIKSGQHTKFDYELTKLENLTKRISEKYFNRDVILNYNLLDFLANNYNTYSNRYNSIILLLSNEKEYSIKFIDGYISKGNNIELFINSLCKSWQRFWHFIQINNYSDEIINEYFILILKYANIDDVSKLSKESDISMFIDEMSYFLSLAIPNINEERFIQLIQKLDIRFANLEPSSIETKTLFDFVYKNNYYQINKSNIELILSESDNKLDKNELNSSHFSTIQQSTCNFLRSYLQQEINFYVENVLLKIEENNNESMEVVVELLNNEELREDLKHEIIKKQKTVIEKLTSIDDFEIQQKLFEYNKILPSWNNIFTYYENNELEDFDDILIDYFNVETNYKILSAYKLNSEKNKTDEFIKAISLKLIKCKELCFESFKELVKSIPYIYNRLEIASIDANKVEYMIKIKLLILTNENFVALKENFIGLSSQLIEIHQNNFISKFDDFNLDSNDILPLLKSDIFNKKNKLELVKKIDESLILKNKDISKVISELLANSEIIPLKYDVLKNLIENSSSIENRIKLLNLHFELLDKTQKIRLTELLGDKYKKLFKKQHKPTFKNNTLHNILFSKLEKENLIHRFEVNSKNEDEIKVFANY